MRKIWSGIAIACWLGSGGLAHATVSVFCEAEQVIVQDTNPPNMPVTLHDEMFANTFPEVLEIQHAGGHGSNGGGDASSHVTATFGAIAASSGASDFDDSDVYPQASASGLADAAIQDAVHVHSATLDDGTPVQLDVALHLTTNTSEPAEGVSYFASVRATLDLGSPGDLHLEYRNVDTPVSVLSGTLDTTVGAKLDLAYAAYAHSSVDAAATDTSATSAGLTIQPRIAPSGANPDVTLTADSGYGYGSPVPEPASPASAGIGALAWMGLRYSKRPCRPAPSRNRAAPSRVSPDSIVARPRRSSFASAAASSSDHCS
jgi:hypothetical protein